MDTTPHLKVIPASWTERPEFRAWLRELGAAFRAHVTTKAAKSDRSPRQQTAASKEKLPSSTNKSRTPEQHPVHSIAQRRAKTIGARRREHHDKRES